MRDPRESYPPIDLDADPSAAAARDTSQVATPDASQVLSDASRVDQPLQTRQLPAVPAWVDDVGKWATLDRATRRRLERHHRKQQRRQ
jgi:hypothetical protein